MGSAVALEVGKSKSAGTADIIAKIKDPDRSVREDAANELAENPHPELTAKLCRLLADPDISVRNLVAEILVKMGENATPALIDESTSADHDVRKFVVDTMALIKDHRFLPILIRLLNDDNENVVCSAAEALGAIGGAETVEPLISALNRHPYAGLQIVEALGNTGSPKALPALFDKLESGDVVLKYAAVEAVSKINGPEAIDRLLNLLRVKNKELRDVVLTSILNKTNSDFRGVLADLTGGKFVDFLIEAAGSDDLEVKKAALGELAFWNGRKVIEVLVEALNEADEGVGHLAKSALRAVGASGLPPIINGLQSGPDRVRIALVEISSGIKSPDLLKEVMKLANSAEPEVRLAVARTLAEYGDPEVIKTLAKLAEDEVGHVRAEALKSLGFLGDPGAANIIAKHLDDEYTDVCEAALGALILIGGEEAISLLKKDLDSPNLRRNLMAIKGLGWIGEDESVEALVSALSNEQPQVRRYAVIGLAKMKYPGLEKNLTFMLADENPEVRKAVIDAYLSISGPAAGDKIRVLLDDDDVWVRFYAINALISIEDKGNLEKLLEIITTQPPFVQIAIINLIAKHDTPEVRFELQKLAGSENRDISGAARQAMETIYAG